MLRLRLTAIIVDCLCATYTLRRKGANISGRISDKISGLGDIEKGKCTKRKAERLEKQGIPPKVIFLKKKLVHPEVCPEVLVVKGLSSSYYLS